MKTRSKRPINPVLFLFFGILLFSMVLGLVASNQPKILNNKAAEPTRLVSGAVANCLKTCKSSANLCSCVSSYLQGVGLTTIYPTITTMTQPAVSCFKTCEQNRQQCSCVSQYLQNIPIQQIPSLFPSLPVLGQQIVTCFETCKKNSQKCACVSQYLTYATLIPIPTLPPLPTVLPQSQAVYACLLGCRQDSNKCVCVSQYLQNTGSGIQITSTPKIRR